MFIQNNNFKQILINLVILFLPISFIIGNLVLNLNVALIIIFAFIFYRLKIFEKKFNLTDWLIIVLFLYLIVNGVLNNYLNFDFPNPPNKNFLFFKSVSYLRFLFFYLVIRFLIIENLINFKFLFLTFGASALFVSIDVIIQYFFGTDLFGFEGSGRRLGGPFGNEYIAGSFIQRFLIFMPLFFTFFSKLENKILFNLILIMIFIIGALGLVLAGNRIPLVMFSLVLFLCVAYIKDLQRIFIIFLILGSISLYYVVNTKAEFGHHYKGFIMKSFQIKDYVSSKFSSKETEILLNSHIKELETGFLTWEQNKTFGGGIKSFYFNCTKIRNSVMDKYGGTNCNSHPHNYYLEIATALGLLGLVIVISLFTYILIETLKTLHFRNHHTINTKLLIPFYALFIAEIFPFKTTGSFFTTSNATYLFLIISFIIALNENTKKIKK